MMAPCKEPQRRYASVDQLSRDLTRYLEGLPVRATADTFRYRAGKFLRRNKLAVAATAAIVAAIIMGTLGTVAAGIRASRHATRAQAAAEQASHEAARANLEADAAERVTTLLAELYESAAPNSMGGFRLGMPRGLAPDLESQHELSAQNTQSIIDELAAKPALQARLLDAIANTYVGMGRIDDAAPLLEKSRKIIAANPDASDADVARNLRSFGWLRFMQGRYGEALRPAREVLAIHRAQLGENAEETLQSKLHLAILLAILEIRHNEAETLTNEVIQARRESLGPEHLSVGFALLVKVLVHASAQQNARAVAPGLEAVRIFSAHPETSGLAKGITGIANSVVQTQLGNRQAALDHARASLERIREVLGDDHPIVANQALYTRRVMEETGDGEQAEKLYRAAIDQLRSRQEEPGYLYARNIERLGLIALKAQQNDEAEAYLREALAIYRRSLCEDSWRVGWTLAHLGMVLRQAGRYEEAIATLHEAIDIFQRVAAHSPLDTVAWCQLRLDDAIRQLAATKQSRRATLETRRGRDAACPRAPLRPIARS